jgi:NADPH2:quinone reductase
VVGAVGPGAVLAVGQPVLVVPELPDGALQERLTVPESQVYAVPDAMPMAVAAVLHIAYQTAHVALHRRAGLRAGEWVLIDGAAGGVGSAGIQLARAAGARVIAVATGAAKQEACRAWGAEVVLDGADPELAEAVRAATGGHGADVVLDVVGGETFDRARRAVAFEGRIVVLGFTGGIPEVRANHVLLRNYSVVGLHLATYRRAEPALLRAVHAELLELWAAGRIAPHVHRELPFDGAVEGLGLIADRSAIGRVVLTVSP